MPFDRSKYPPHWAEISRSIKERDGWKCKFCGLPQYAVFTYHEQDSWTLGEDGAAHKTYKEARSSRDFWNHWESEACSLIRYRVCVLTIAHLKDMDPMNVAGDNLAALCNRCHLRLDAKHHAATASRTRAEKAGQMALEVL